MATARLVQLDGSNTWSKQEGNSGKSFTNPIGQITGQFEFNEVVFTDAFMPDDHVLGKIDGDWKQATSELAYERSGPACCPLPDYAQPETPLRCPHEFKLIMERDQVR